MIAIAGNLTLNSTLNISAANGFTATNYTLFTYTGALSGVPTLGNVPSNFAGYNYSLNTNTAGRVVFVVSNAVSSQPSFSSATLLESNGGIALAGSGGIPAAGYRLLASTNLAQPVNQWEIVATNQFDGTGSFLFTNVLQTNSASMFFCCVRRNPTCPKFNKFCTKPRLSGRKGRR